MRIFEDIDVFLKTVEKRRGDDHKGIFGHGLILAGSEGMIGAALLSVKGALLSGAGLVTLSIEKEFFPIIHQSIWEAMVIDREHTIDNISKFSAIGMGPGLSVKDKSERSIMEIFTSYKGPLVIDADGLNTISERDLRGELKSYKGDKVLTPHPKEALRLLGISQKEYLEMGREKVALELSRLSLSTVVLKGHKTVVTDGKTMLYVNSTGNPGMATAGSGDVLTGIITGLITTGVPSFEASCIGVYVHGLSGDIGARRKGMRSLLATDILESLPESFMITEREKSR